MFRASWRFVAADFSQVKYHISFRAKLPMVRPPGPVKPLLVEQVLPGNVRAQIGAASVTRQAM
jgi:hypothetical protein